MHRERECGAPDGPGSRSSRGRAARSRRRARARALGIGQQPIAVRRDAIAWAEEPELARLGRRARDLRQPDQSRTPADGRHRAAQAAAARPGAGAAPCTRPTRARCRRRSRRAPLRLDVRLDRVAVQQHLAAAAESTPAGAPTTGTGARWRRRRRPARRGPNAPTVPVGALAASRTRADVRTDREVLALVVHHERAVVRGAAADGVGDQRHGIRVERVDFDVNSRQTTPSPMSQSDAEALLASGWRPA